jgi:hypothetical protein
MLRLPESAACSGLDDVSSVQDAVLVEPPSEQLNADRKTVDHPGRHRHCREAEDQRPVRAMLVW